MALPDRDLARLIDDQIVALEDVRTALAAERSALDARDADALDRAVSAKEASVVRAGELERQRQAVLHALGFAARPGAMGRAWRPDGHLDQRWQQLLRLTRECQALNEGNGALIGGQRRRVEATLRLVRGGPATSAEYGAAGRPRAAGSARPLGSI